jgi:IS605 OrfB family transposase
LQFRVFQENRLPVGADCSGEFCEDARGRWYLILCVPAEEKTFNKNGGEIGIDLGVKDLATLSNGKKYSNNRYYRMMENKLSRAQKHKKKKQARNIHAKIRNRRMDDIHKASTEIAKNNKLIVVGKLNSKAIAKTKMAKSILDAAPSALRTMLKNKARVHQHVYIEVSENFSTQICSNCEVIPDSSPRGVKDLGVREWVCSSCGAIHDRDVNAAMNILRFGRESLVS